MEGQTTILSQTTDILSQTTEGVKGTYGLSAKVFNFIADNPFYALMCCLSFAGVGLGLDDNSAPIEMAAESVPADVPVPIEMAAESVPDDVPENNPEKSTKSKGDKK